MEVEGAFECVESRLTGFLQEISDVRDIDLTARSLVRYQSFLKFRLMVISHLGKVDTVLELIGEIGAFFNF